MNTLELSLLVLKRSRLNQKLEGESPAKKVQSSMNLLKFIHAEVCNLEELIPQGVVDRDQWRSECFKILEAVLPDQLFENTQTSEAVDTALAFLEEIYRQAPTDLMISVNPTNPVPSPPPSPKPLIFDNLTNSIPTPSPSAQISANPDNPSPPPSPSPTPKPR